MPKLKNLNYELKNLNLNYVLQRDRHKGVEHLIDIENPNHVAPKMKKVTELGKGDDSKPQLSRKERWVHTESN